MSPPPPPGTPFTLLQPPPSTLGSKSGQGGGGGGFYYWVLVGACGPSTIIIKWVSHPFHILDSHRVVLYGLCRYHLGCGRGGTFFRGGLTRSRGFAPCQIVPLRVICYVLSSVLSRKVAGSHIVHYVPIKSAYLPTPLLVLYPG